MGLNFAKIISFEKNCTNTQIVSKNIDTENIYFFKGKVTNNSELFVSD